EKAIGQLGIFPRELYGPSTGIWTTLNNMNNVGQEYAAVVLKNRQVLVTGGTDTSALSSCELYDLQQTRG
ncbi:unnamed protein product, partial [Rotaria socialis]